MEGKRAHASTSPFLRGNWAPVLTNLAPQPCRVTSGALPPSLRGSFLRIGPNPSRPEELQKNYHFFAGDGLIHGVELDGLTNTATYRRRFVDTPHYLTGEDSVAGEEGEGGGERGGLANTAMVWHAGKLLALEEGSKPYHIALPSLATIGRYTFSGALRHNFTAHPKVCATTGEMVFFGYGAHEVEGSDAFIHTSVVGREGDLLTTIPVPVRRPTMFHDCAITRNYTLTLDFPLWDMGGPTRVEDRSSFIVVPRHAASAEAAEAETVRFQGSGLYGYHTANAFERPKEPRGGDHGGSKGGRGAGGGGSDGSSAGGSAGTTLIELVMVAAVGFSFSRSNAKALHLRAWTFDLDTGETVAERTLSDVPCEFPIVDPRHVGIPNRFVWASRLSQSVREPLALDGFLRHDLRTGETIVVSLPGERRGSEVQFVPRYPESLEGDGFLLLLAYDPATDESELMVYDAMCGGDAAPLAVVAVGTRVPNGFHALWVSADRYEGCEGEREGTRDGTGAGGAGTARDRSRL